MKLNSGKNKIQIAVCDDSDAYNVIEDFWLI